MNESLDAARRVCWALAGECRQGDVVVVGVATPLAAAAAVAARQLLVADLTVILGGAVDPPALDVADLLLDPAAVTRRAPAVLGQVELLELIQRGGVTLQFVSPAQVDGAGNLNSVGVETAEGWRRLAGCLALPDTAALVGRLIAYRVDPERFVVDAVDHVTGLGRAEAVRDRWHLPGRGVVAVVTRHGRQEVTANGLSAPAPLAAVPPEADELFDRVLDRHCLLALETRGGRDAARGRLAGLAASRIR